MVALRDGVGLSAHSDGRVEGRRRVVGRVEQSHGGVEWRRRVVGEERVGEVEVGGGASHRRLDRRLFRESTPPRPTHLPGERHTRLGPIGIRERNCAENYTK